jgi:hypothetical protein
MDDDTEDNPYLTETFYRLNHFLDVEVHFLMEKCSDDVIDAELAHFKTWQTQDSGLARAYQHILERVRPERGFMVRLKEAMEHDGIPFPLANDVADSEE